jgi:hypothetical protein
LDEWYNRLVKQISLFTQSTTAKIHILEAACNARMENYLLEWMFCVTLVAQSDNTPTCCPQCSSKNTELNRIDLDPDKTEGSVWYYEWMIECKSCGYKKISQRIPPPVAGLNVNQYARDMLLEDWAAEG